MFSGLVQDQRHPHLGNQNPLPAGDDPTHGHAQGRRPLLTDEEAPLSLRPQGGGTGQGHGHLHLGDVERKRVVLHQIMECKFLRLLVCSLYASLDL